MGFLEAAKEVLRQAGQPLHYDEIAQRALAQGLIETKGQTPNRTLNAQISTSIRSGNSPFVRVGRGMYRLADAAQPAPEPPKPPPERDYLSYKDAAQHVLAEAGRPLHYKEVTQRALDAKLISPQGLTPEATMGAQMYADIKRNGASSVFRKEGKGIFGLAVWEKGVSGITRLAAKQSAVVKRQLIDHLLSIKPVDFERLVARLLGAMGYDNITVTRRNADGGVDVLADLLVEHEIGVRIERIEVFTFDEERMWTEDEE
jgi:restriction system protein